MKSKNIFWSVVLIAVALYAVMLGWSLPKISSDTNGLMPFDLRPSGYSFEEARTFLAALSDEGRAFYQNVQHRLDTLFPFFESLAVAWGIYLLMAQTWWRWPLALTALPGMVFDYLENAKVAEMLKAGADGLTTSLVDVASFYTQMKSVFVTLSLISLMIAIVWWFVQSRAQRIRANTQK